MTVNIARRTMAPPRMDQDQFLADFFGAPRNEENAQQWDKKIEELARKERIRLDMMSPKGALGLPPLLDARRIEWQITDGAFAIAPLFDRVYLHQIELHVTGKKGLIHLPDTIRKKEHLMCPRGIIVGAGLMALDALRSNGVDLGHIVRFVHVNPWRLVVDYAEGFEPQVLVMTDGCLTGSEDLADMLRSGAMKIGHGDDGKHHYLDAEGRQFDPTMPAMPDVI